MVANNETITVDAFGDGAVVLDFEQELDGYEKPCQPSEHGGAEPEESRGSWWLHFVRGTVDDAEISPLKYVLFPEHGKLKRLVWLVIISCAVAALSRQVIDRVLYLASRPLTVNVEIESAAEVTFPKVIICNSNNYVNSKIKANPLANNLLLNYHGLGTPLTAEDYAVLRAMDPVKLVTDFVHDKEDMFLSMSYNSQELSTANLTGIITNRGLCYQINDGLNGTLLTASYAGKEMGLELLLNVEQYKYYYGKSARKSAGFVIQILDQAETPMVVELGFAVAPGTENFIAIKASKTVDVPSPYGECGERPLPNFNTYSRTKCRLECAAAAYMKECGCVATYMPGPPCDPVDTVECAWKIRENLNTYYAKCDCPRSCEKKTFSHSLSYAQYPSIFWSEKLAQQVNVSDNLSLTPSFFQENLVSVKIFFEDTDVHVTRQSKAYSSVALLSDIGGALGLWLGGSILTLVEIMDICGSSYQSRKGMNQEERKKKEGKCMEEKKEEEEGGGTEKKNIKMMVAKKSKKEKENADEKRKSADVVERAVDAQLQEENEGQKQVQQLKEKEEGDLIAEEQEEVEVEMNVGTEDEKEENEGEGWVELTTRGLDTSNNMSNNNNHDNGLVEENRSCSIS